MYSVRDEAPQGFDEQADTLQQSGNHEDLPTEVVLFTVYARSCDPTLDYLRMGDQYTDDQVIHFLLTTCFDGLQ